MVDKVANQETSRGTIIVDASALKHLKGAIPGHFKSPNRKGEAHYFDIIPFLAKNGFTILIPEVVLYEAGDMLTNGKVLFDYFPPNPTTGQKKFVIPSDFRKFLSEVCQGKYPNIRVVESITPEVKDYLNKLKDVTKIYNGPCAFATRAICDAQKEKNTLLLGNTEVEKLLDAGNQGSLGADITFISDYRALSKRSAIQNRHVNLLDVKGLIYAIVGNQLHEKVGVNSEVTFDQFCKDSFHQAQSLTSIAEVQEVPKGHLDSLPLDDGTFQFDLPNGPFFQKMAELAKSLPAETREISTGQAALLERENRKKRKEEWQGMQGLLLFFARFGLAYSFIAEHPAERSPSALAGKLKRALAID